MLDDFLAILYREDGAAVLFNEKLLDLHIEFVILRQQDLHTGQINGVGCVISHGGRGGIDGKGQCDMECRPGALPTGKFIWPCSCSSSASVGQGSHFGNVAPPGIRFLSSCCVPRFCVGIQPG